jgi:regulator of sigma E protease
MLQNIISTVSHYGLPFIFVISVVVFVHEFGHYWVARRCGVKIEAFSIGFGREIFGWTDRHGTRWKVSWLPLGGYVKMFGDSNAASMPGEGVKTMSGEEKRVAFFHQNVDKRIAVVVAGPASNYLFAILVLAVLFVFQGQPYTAPDISDVMENSAAAKAGLQKGDHVVMVDGSSIERFEDIKRIVALNAGTPIAFKVERGGATVSFTLTPEIVSMTDRFGGEHRIGRIGITSDELKYRSLTPGQALYHAVLETWSLTTATLKAVGQMILGVRDTDELGGPLRIAEMSGHVAQDGLVSLVWFTAIISINLGLVNLFPIPLLDGGHLAYYLIERMRGRPLHERIQDVGMRVGMALVLSLMVFATWNDLVHLKVISYLRGLLFS